MCAEIKTGARFMAAPRRKKGEAMSDYIRYREEKGLSNNQIIRTIAEGYPGYTKIQNTMVNNPQKYGICLLPEAEKLLVDKFGEGEGIKLRGVKRRESRRKKSNRLVVRLNDEMYNRVRDLMFRVRYTSVQAFLEDALTAMVEQEMEEQT